jgi:hypothetical protein
MPSFTTIIDLDHSAINTAAISLLNLLRTPPPPSPAHAASLRQAQLSALQHLTYRLIRHDLSEELIMRPAFIAYMGPQLGTLAAEHDRQDHEHARLVLLELYRNFSSCALHDTERMAQLTAQFRALMGELAEHMKRESGEEMPALERGLGRSESEELGRRYQETLVVEPGLVLGNDGRRVFEGGVGEYVECGKERLLEVWEMVVREMGCKRKGGKL